MNLVSRTRNLVERVSWISTVTSSYWSALSFWLSASRNPNHVGRGAYLGTPMSFRGVDAMAIKDKMEMIDSLRGIRGFLTEIREKLR